MVQHSPGTNSNLVVIFCSDYFLEKQDGSRESVRSTIKTEKNEAIAAKVVARKELKINKRM